MESGLMFGNKSAFTACLLACAWVFAATAQAAVYKCTDGGNRTYYQDRPCQDLTSARLPSSLSTMAGKLEEKAYFWKAAGDKGTLYLLGSLDFGTQTPYSYPQVVMDAFASSNTMVVEADLNRVGDKELVSILGARGRYADKSDLETHVKPSTWSRTVAMGTKLGLTEEVLQTLKPWRAALTLAAESLKQTGYSAEWGVSQNFLKKAEGSKPVLELDSHEQQIQTLEGLSDQEQEQLLILTLQDLARGADRYQSIIDAWKHGDAEAMDLITRQSFDAGSLSSSLFKTLLEDRNERMANKLSQMAEEGKIFFVVLGAGHLAGDKGVLKLLQSKGLKISQP